MEKKYESSLGQLVTNDVITSAIKVVLGVFGLFAAAQMLIPLKPVPITFQTVMISLIGLSYTPRLSFITVGSYLTAGMIGLPMFTKFGSGIGHFIGPSGGYLIGFLIAAPLMGTLKKYFSVKFAGIATCCFLGHIVIYCLGIAWLSTLIGFNQAIYSGFLVYIPTGILKIAIFSYLFSYISNYGKSI